MANSTHKVLIRKGFIKDLGRGGICVSPLDYQRESPRSPRPIESRAEPKERGLFSNLI